MELKEPAQVGPVECSRISLDVSKVFLSREFDKWGKPNYYFRFENEKGFSLSIMLSSRNESNAGGDLMDAFQGTHGMKKSITAFVIGARRRENNEIELKGIKLSLTREHKEPTLFQHGYKRYFIDNAQKSENLEVQMTLYIRK